MKVDAVWVDFAVISHLTFTSGERTFASVNGRSGPMKGGIQPMPRCGVWIASPVLKRGLKGFLGLGIFLWNR